MAFFTKIITSFANPFNKFTSVTSKLTSIQTFSPVLTSERSLMYKLNGWTDWRMFREVRRRKVVKQYGKLRIQINALRHNVILPQGIRDIAQKEIAALPTDSCTTKLHNRCVLSSRARGKLREYRMSRIIWRKIADANQMSGVERAMW